MVANGWEGIFTITASTAGALTGLLFVALATHLNALIERHDLRHTAGATLMLYMIAFLFSLLPLAPLGPSTIGWLILAVDVGTAVLTGLLWRSMFRSGVDAFTPSEMGLRIFRQFAGHVFLATAAVALINGRGIGFVILAVLCVGLITIAVYQTWDMIFRAARPKLR